MKSARQSGTMLSAPTWVVQSSLIESIVMDTFEPFVSVTLKGTSRPGPAAVSAWWKVPSASASLTFVRVTLVGQVTVTSTSFELTEGALEAPAVPVFLTTPHSAGSVVTWIVTVADLVPLAAFAAARSPIAQLTC